METRSKRARTLDSSKNPKQEKENEETQSSGGAENLGYEQFREQRIKENMERMQKLGIFDLSLKLKSDFLPPKRFYTNPSDKSTPKPPSEPLRRSSRLKSVTPISYSERRTSSYSEVCNQKKEKLLGDCKTSWTLFVDGYNEAGKRIYDEVKGKTCHQCRQKTIAHHTHCSKCDSVQGQFCGDCLYVGYGENVIEANQNPSWICPVCRGICNCSFCLYRKVSRLGFKSVAHYLIRSRRSRLISEDPGTEPISANELQLFEDTGSQASLHDEPLDEDEGHDGFSKPHLHDNNDDGMEEEEAEVHHLENKHVDGFPEPPPLPLSESLRRSSRLKSVAPVNYSELFIFIKTKSEKLFGDCKTIWTLFVDGYDENGKRIYDQVKGKTCHQCREKTLGRHTHCSKCKLVQGQFCGDCLYMRYGENVIEANQNPSWICPVCRGICNCIFCLYKKVSRLGFRSVAHYLIRTHRYQLISEDPGTEPVSANELPLISYTRSQGSLHNESLGEDEGPDGSSKPQLHDNKNDGMGEDKEEVHYLEYKNVVGFPKPQPEDKKDDGMEEEEDLHDLKNKHVYSNGAYNKDNDDESKKEKVDKDNQDLDNF